MRTIDKIDMRDKKGNTIKIEVEKSDEGDIFVKMVSLGYNLRLIAFDNDYFEVNPTGKVSLKIEKGSKLA